MIHDGLAITTEVGAWRSVAPCTCGEHFPALASTKELAESHARQMRFQHFLAETTAGADQHADKS